MRPCRGSKKKALFKIKVSMKFKYKIYFRIITNQYIFTKYKIIMIKFVEYTLIDCSFIVYTMIEITKLYLKEI